LARILIISVRDASLSSKGVSSLRGAMAG